MSHAGLAAFLLAHCQRVFAVSCGLCSQGRWCQLAASLSLQSLWQSCPPRREKNTFMNQMRRLTVHSVARLGPWCLYYEARRRKTQEVQKTDANSSFTSSMLLSFNLG